MERPLIVDPALRRFASRDFFVLFAFVTKGVKYEFEAKPWQYAGQGKWIFVSLPNELSKEIRHYFGNEEEGWGRLKAHAQIGATEWATAIWFDSKKEAYLLPLRADIRKREKIEEGKTVKVAVYI